jgi:predicted transcriptional regulator
MVGEKRNQPGQIADLILNASDRGLLDQLRAQIAERSHIRAAPADRASRERQETKRVRLDRNQNALEELLDEALTRPALARALSEAGHDLAELRQAGANGTWARDVAPAVAAIHSPTLREQEQLRREMVARAALTMIDYGLDRSAPPPDPWIDELERGVRASFNGKRVSDQDVAERLIGWAMEAMSAVSEPVAVTARTMLIERAFEAELTEEKSGRQRLVPALRIALEQAGIKSVTVTSGEPSTERAGTIGLDAERPNSEDERQGQRETNRIFASDEGESVPARRQIAELADLAQSSSDLPSVTKPGLFVRLREIWAAKRQGDVPAPVGPNDGDASLPDALKRRYAVHISPDGRTIELFEMGAKTPAIVLDAKSISTKHDNGAVIADIVSLARDRGWQSLKIAGTPEFKDAVWLEARKAGLVVQHEPSNAIRAAFAKWDQDRPANQLQPAAPSHTEERAPRRDEKLAQLFADRTAEQRLADPRLRNAQLELMIGFRTAEKELKRPIAEMPEVAKALTAAIREQLAQGRVFDVPFVKPEAQKRAPRPVANPRIEAEYTVSAAVGRVPIK